ncbi:MAG: transglutaminase domain-containing protein [Phycisphaerales bacterium]|nr:transglutaminase domain-containing protein [Phycisphaerales bacterium]
MSSFLNPRFVRATAGAVLGACLLTTGCVSPWPADVERGLDKAGDNRAELKRALRHYRRLDDPLKLQAAEFLIANMEGHGYSLAALYDADRNEIEFDALDYESFNEALAVLDALEEEHGTLDFKRKRFDNDLDVITADYLIENIDLAFEAWREKPWAADVSFDVFCEYILPYRGSNEPIGSWRGACLDRHADLVGEMDDPTDMREAGRRIGADVHRWVGFHDLYYLHPTDQSFEEMDERGKGRCEDISNMMGYAARANAVLTATDYTPYWANRDNNHAWEVVLDANGEGKAGLSNRAAKVYRKMFSIQPGSLAMIKSSDEEAPRWLAGKNYKDVTADYLDTTDVTVRLENELPEGVHFAYICVFNDGDWRAIHWGRIDGDHVTFTKMGRGIAYLPAYYVDEELQPAGPAFILTDEGEVRSLVSSDDSLIAIEISVTTPATPDADTRVVRPIIKVKAGEVYELSVWKDDWVSLGKKTAGDEPVVFEDVPAGGLYWMVAEGSRRKERIFTIEVGRQIMW